VDGEDLALDCDDALGSGWQRAELQQGAFTQRWTKGAALLSPGARFIVVDLGGLGSYWREPDDSAVALFG
jgi:hypothetical protein